MFNFIARLQDDWHREKDRYILLLLLFMGVYFADALTGRLTGTDPSARRQLGMLMLFGGLFQLIPWQLLAWFSAGGLLLFGALIYTGANFSLISDGGLLVFVLLGVTLLSILVREWRDRRSRKN